MKVKQFKAKLTNVGGCTGLIVPSWISKAFDVSKGDEVVVRLEKINKESSQPQDNGPVV